MKVRKTLYTWLTTRLALIIRDEETFEEKRQIPYTPAKLVFFGFVVFMLIFTFGFWLGGQFFSQNFLSKDEGELVSELVRINLAADSLAEQINQRQKYIDDLGKVFGENPKPLKDDSLRQKKQRTGKASDSIDINHLESAELRFRENYENAKVGQSVGFNQNPEIRSLQELFFYRPSEGVINEKYSPTQNIYGIQLLCKAQQTVLATQAGRVIMRDWTSQKAGTIVIQHQPNLLSIYRYCEAINVEVGSEVQAGQAIANLAQNKNNNEEVLFEFEIWYKGKPINPEEFISF